MGSSNDHRSHCSHKHLLSYSIKEAQTSDTYDIIHKKFTQLRRSERATALKQEVGGTKNGLVIFTQMTTTEALEIHNLRMIHIEIHLKEQRPRDMNPVRVTIQTECKNNREEYQQIHLDHNV